MNEQALRELIASGGERTHHAPRGGCVVRYHRETGRAQLKKLVDAGVLQVIGRSRNAHLEPASRAEA